MEKRTTETRLCLSISLASENPNEKLYASLAEQSSTMLKITNLEIEKSAKANSLNCKQKDQFHSHKSHEFFKIQEAPMSQKSSPTTAVDTGNCDQFSFCIRNVHTITK